MGKEIEVFIVTEKNDEASLTIELAEVQNTGSSKVKLKAWFQNNSTGKIEFKSSVWLKDGDHLGEKTNNSSHNNYKIDRIFKSLKTGK